MSKYTAHGLAHHIDALHQDIVTLSQEAKLLGVKLLAQIERELAAAEKAAAKAKIRLDSAKGKLAASKRSKSKAVSAVADKIRDSLPELKENLDAAKALVAELTRMKGTQMLRAKTSLAAEKALERANNLAEKRGRGKAKAKAKAKKAAPTAGA